MGNNDDFSLPIKKGPYSRRITVWITSETDKVLTQLENAFDVDTAEFVRQSITDNINRHELKQKLKDAGHE